MHIDVKYHCRQVTVWAVEYTSCPHYEQCKKLFWQIT